MTTFTNLGLPEMTPGDPAVRNAWGAILNNGLIAKIDNATSGIVSLDVSGATNVQLTFNNGTVDQSTNAHFKLTGVLTGAVDVLWPGGHTFMFSVSNQTTGAFALSCGANNGGVPAGAVVAVQQSSAAMLASDGTDVFARAVSTSGEIPSGTKMVFVQTTAPVGWTQDVSVNDSVLRVVNDATGGTTGGSWTITGVTAGGTSISQAQLPNCNFTVTDPGHIHNFANSLWAAVGGIFQVSNTPGGNDFNINNNTLPAATGISVASGGAGTAHTHTITADGTWRPAYVNILVASKN